MRARIGIALAVSLLGGCGGSSGPGAPAMPASVAPTIQTEPLPQTVPAGQSATFSVVASGTPPLTYQWQKNGQNVAGATAATYHTPPVAAGDDGTGFDVTVTNAVASTVSATALLHVTAPVAATDVLTYHNDNLRTGQNAAEGILTPANVNAAGFGLLRTLAADGLVDAQPLVVSGLSVGGVTRNVLFVASEHGSIYSYDADDGTPLAHVNLVGSGETSGDGHGCQQVAPEIGITSTPVIDRNAGAHGTLYAVAMSKDGSGRYLQRLHALDLVTLAEQANSPVAIQATYPGTGANSSGGNVIFDPAQYKERAALLLLGGIVYTAWASHCDNPPYTGWIIGYDGQSLAQVRVLNVIANGSDGAIWQSGGGMAADGSGNIYALVANGTFDTSLDGNGRPSLGDYGNAYIKVSSANPLTVIDYFAENNDVSESAADVDLGSGAPMLLPPLQDAGNVMRNLAVGAGKDGHLYVVDRGNMGKFSGGGNHIWQDLPNVLPGGIWSAPAYFNGTIYYADVSGTLKAFVLRAAKLPSTPSSQSSMTFAYPGASPAVSANGTSAGIVWALESNVSQTAVLHAFDAGNLASELYNSNQASGGRDQFGAGNKYMTPTIANGKVYVGTPSGVAVFGLL